MKDYVANGIPFFRSKEIIELFNHSNINDVLYIREEKYEVIKNQFGVPVKDDLLLTSVGTVGIPYLVKNKDKFYFKDGNLTWFRNFSRNIKPKYLFYYFQSPLEKKRIINYSKGSSQSALTIETLKEIKIELPPINFQEIIIKTLSTYDDLIDKNQKRIQLLEEAARLLYREWFVYFRFPGHENAKIIDGIPKGWKKEKLNKYVEFKRGVEPGSKNYLENSEMFSYPFFRVSDLVSRDPEIYVDESYTKGALLDKKDIVVSLDGSVGIVSMGLEGSYSTGIRKLIIKNNHINRGFIYCLMKSKYVQGIIKAYSKGTTIQHAGESVKHIKPLMPTKDLMDRFGEISEPMIDEMLILLEQNKKIAQARDLLLPRLMSGKINVSEFDNNSISVESEVEKIVN